MISEDELSEQAARLRRARIAKGYARAIDACKAFGFKPSTYGGHESGSRGIGRAAARYAKAYGVSEGWLLTGEGEAPPTPQVPVMGMAAGSVVGEHTIESEPIDFVSCPPALENVRDAYAIYVRGTSMEPAHMEGDLRFVHPHKSPRAGDTVIIQQHVRDNYIQAFIKLYQKADERYLYTRQFNPEAAVEFEQRNVLACHKVLTINELFA